MSDYSYNQNWQRTKEYLIRSLFTDTSALSPIPEESVESSTPTTEELVNPSVFDDSSNASSRSDSPVPPLIIEVEPNRHDDPPEYYKQLHARMLRLYRKLFIERCERVSSIDFGDSQDEDSNNNEETTHEFTESNDAVHSKDLDDIVGVYDDENNEEITAEQVIEAHDSISGNDYNDSQSLTENINQEETVTQQTIEERESTSDSDHDDTQSININNEDTTPQQLIEGDSLESGNDYVDIHHNSDHSLTDNINDEEKITQQMFEDNSESSNDYEDELALIDSNNADLTVAVTQEEYNLRSPILQSFGLRATRHAVLEDNEGSTTEFFVQDPGERASSNISITERELEIMRGATERHQSFGLLRAISSSSIGEIEDTKSVENMESSIDSTPKTHPRKRLSEDDVTTTPTKIVKYGNQETQTTIEDTWDSYFRFNFFEGTPKIFKLCSCRNLCDC